MLRVNAPHSRGACASSWQDPHPCAGPVEVLQRTARVPDLSPRSGWREHRYRQGLYPWRRGVVACVLFPCTPSPPRPLPGGFPISSSLSTLVRHHSWTACAAASHLWNSTHKGLLPGRRYPRADATACAGTAASEAPEPRPLRWRRRQPIVGPSRASVNANPSRPRVPLRGAPKIYTAPFSLLWRAL